jgi:hypothetical protein
VVGIQQDADESLLFFARNGIARFRDNRFTVEREGGHRDYKIYHRMYRPQFTLVQI